MPLSTIPAALDALRAGRMIVVVDDEDRENEGDLIVAAEHATPAAINFMASHGRGLVCLALTGQRLDELQIPLMVAENSSATGTAFCVSIEAKGKTTTGISAFDRAATVKAVLDAAACPEDFARPGHTFPLRAHADGVLGRAGHTEASVDLARLAGLEPAAVICEIMNEDGTMARRPDLEDFAARHGLLIVSVAQVVAWRQVRPVTRRGDALLPTRYGSFQAVAYRTDDGSEHLALVVGDVTTGDPPLVRLHSECLTGDALGSLRCDCGEQLDRALRLIGTAGRGVLLYLRQEGRGIGLVNKVRAYALQDGGLDTVEANEHLGFRPDARDYAAAAAMLADLGVDRVRLLTNNPAKVAGLEERGVAVAQRVPLTSRPTRENRHYLLTKRAKLGHLIDAPATEAIDDLVPLAKGAIRATNA